MSPGYRGRKSHLDLGEGLFDPVRPAAFPDLVLRYRNQRAALSIGLEGLSDGEWIDHFGRFAPLPDSLPAPLALRYHGHQFRHYNPDLGDGRGFLFAQAEERETGRLLDLGTKGSGRTPWSRGGDGRLTLKGGVREVLATAMLEALGVNTSKSLSLIETGEELERHDEPSPTRASVLVRLSHSHIRIGTFQRLGHEGNAEGLARLVDHSLKHYYPTLWREGDNHAASRLLAATTEAVAETGARWIAAGFVHGVLNTDNINVTGESFDYGPWRFLPTYDPDFTAAYFDQSGLYAFGRQPEALAWNLTRLAETLLPLDDHGELEAALNRFWPAFQTSLHAAILDRLALVSRGREEDAGLTEAVLTFLGAALMGYEQFFFDWRGGEDSRAFASPEAQAYRDDRFADLHARLARYRARGDANLGHAYFRRTHPRTMRIEEMEALWAPIAEADDWALLNAALAEIEEMRQAYAAGTGSAA